MPEQEAYDALLASLELRVIPNTGLIEIGVYRPDPNEAANIANTLAVIYKKQRLSDRQDAKDRELIQLQDEIEKQRTRTEEAYAIMSHIRDQEKIVDPNPERVGESRDVPGPITVDPNADTKANQGIYAYLEAKNRYLQARRILEAAQVRLSTDLLDKGIDHEMAKIWERAEPPTQPLPFSLRRIRYAFGL